MRAAVGDKLPVAALLGWDIPELMDLIKQNDDAKPKGPTDALAVITRHGQQKQAEERQASQTVPLPLVPTDDATPNSGTQDSPLPITTTNDEAEETDTSNQSDAGDETEQANIDVSNLHDSLFSPRGPDKRILTRAQNEQAIGNIPAPQRATTQCPSI